MRLFQEPQRALKKPRGGYRLISTVQISMVWTAYKIGALPKYLHLRVYLALHEIAERRDAENRKRARGNRPARTFHLNRRPLLDEIRSLVGGAGGRCVREALTLASSEGRRPGALLLVDPSNGKLSGIFTDGDLRRLILNHPDQLGRPIQEVMTRSPHTILDTAVAGDAVRMVREHRQDEIPVIDEHGQPVGILDVQDLMAMRLVQG